MTFLDLARRTGSRSPILAPLLLSAGCDHSPPPKEQFREAVAHGLTFKNSLEETATGNNPQYGGKNEITPGDVAIQSVVEGSSSGTYFVDASVGNRADLSFRCTRRTDDLYNGFDCNFMDGPSSPSITTEKEFRDQLLTWQQKQELDRKDEIDAARERAKDMR